MGGGDNNNDDVMHDESDRSGGVLGGGSGSGRCGTSVATAVAAATSLDDHEFSFLEQDEDEEKAMSENEKPAKKKARLNSSRSAQQEKAEEPVAPKQKYAAAAAAATLDDSEDEDKSEEEMPIVRNSSPRKLEPRDLRDLPRQPSKGGLDYMRGISGQSEEEDSTTRNNVDPKRLEMLEIKRQAGKEALEKEREEMMKKIPELYKKHFGQIGFAKFWKMLMPVLILDPYKVPPTPVRADWFKLLEKDRADNKTPCWIAYWYGFAETEPNTCYAYLKPTDVTLYSAAEKKKAHKPPKNLQKKVESGKKLSAKDQSILRAFREMEEDLEKDPSERNRGVEFQEAWEALSLDDIPPLYPVRIAVMGGGNFGLALGTVCARKGIPTTILVREQEVADCINANHTHPRYMQGVTFPLRLRATTNPAEALPDCTYLIHAVPVQYSRKFLESVKQYIPPNTPVLSGSKGIETSSLGFMADILKETLGEDRPYAFLSGPSFAREICEGVATAVVVASEDLLLARDLAGILSDDNFRVFTSKDVIGVEIGGAVKNVIALAAGMCEGLGLGTNAMSGLVTRGCGEMRRLGLTFGARPSTIAGLSGVGDTFGTCFGPLSRNRKFGYRLGQGESMEEILSSSTEVAEGVDTSIALVNLIKTKCKGYRLDLKYPILFGVAAILEGKLTPLEGLKGIMNMPFQMENFDER